MRVELFDVEHGGCTLVTADTGARMLIDCGFNATTGWRPSVHLPNIGVDTIEMFLLTNYDEDHVNDLPNLRRTPRGLPTVRLQSLLRNKSMTSQALMDVKKDGGMGHGIRELVSMIDEYTGGPLGVDWGALSYRVFHNTYPDDFYDTNNLSLVTFLHYYGLHMVFPGDLEKAGWKKLLSNAEFVQQLKTVNVFVASHHGRESGCCEEVFQINGVMPQIVIFSDSGIQYETQETANWYRLRTHGINYDGKRRFVFTTRLDGKITIEAHPGQWTIHT